MKQPDLDTQPYKPTNSLLWGAVVSVIATGLAILAANGVIESSDAFKNIGQTAFGGFFWGWAAAEIKNWLWKRGQWPRRK